MKETITLKELRKRGLLKKGMYFSFPINPEKEVTVTPYFTGDGEIQKFSNEGRNVHLFRYAGETTPESIWFIGNPIPSELKLYGKYGFNNLRKGMNILCGGLISNLKYGVDAGSMTPEQFQELPDYLKKGDYLLSGQKINAEGEHLMIPAVVKGKLTYKTLYRKGSGEFGVCGMLVPEIQISLDNQSIQVTVDDTPGYGTMPNWPYEIVYREVQQKNNDEEEPEKDNTLSKETVNQIIASLENEIKNMKISIRHSEITLCGLKEIAKKL